MNDSIKQVTWDSVSFLKFILVLIGLFMMLACGTSRPSADSERSEARPFSPSSGINSAAPTSITVNNGITITIQKGSVARYIAREQLVRWISAKDVNGETDLVSGKITISSEGKLIPKESRFVVNLKSLKSNEVKRDNYIRENALESNKFPEAIFEITSIEGLQSPLPTTGSIKVYLTGDMTVHGVTQEITWEFSADVEEDNINGIAKTEIEFSRFNIRKPRLPFILSLEDSLRLELEVFAKVQSD